MADQQLVTVTIDGTPVQVPKGTWLVEAAKQIKREIPVYCYHRKMGPAGLCRICLVEIEGVPKLQIACNTAVTDGMVVHTQSDKAADGRRAVLELYLVNHPLDCPICDKGGECDLQDYAMAYGQGYSRSIDPKVSKPKAIDLGPTIVLDEERCVVCQRCVRFDDMIVGERELVLKDRGVRNIIATANGEPYRHNFTGNVTELCPVGALTSKTYRFKSRPWDLRRTGTTCTQCPVGCQMHVDVRVGVVQRTMSVEDDDAISDGWLCDRGRYNVGFYDDPARVTQPMYKQDGRWIQISWDDALDLWATALRQACKADPKSVGVIGGGRLTNEEAFLLQHVFRATGVKNLDWRAGRQRQASPGRNGAKLEDLETANAIVLVGESPSERAPIMDLRVRKAAFQKGAKLIRIASAERAYPSPIPSQDVSSVAEAIKALPKDANRIAVVWDGCDAALVSTLLEKLPGAEILTYITGEQANARGAEAMGMLPFFGPGYSKVDGGLDGAGMLDALGDGRLAVLSIFGANPALHYPDAAAVKGAPFVVVSDLFMTETAKAATLVLPAKGGFEKTGTTTNLAGDVLPVNAAQSLESPPDALSDLEMIVALAEKLGVDLPVAEEVDATVLRHLANSPEDFTLGDERFARHPEVSKDPEVSKGSFRVVFQTRIFAGGGTSAHDARIAELRPLPEAAFSPEDAAKLGVSTGDYVDLAGLGKLGRPSTGALSRAAQDDTADDAVARDTVMHDLLVEVRPGMPNGTIALIDGLPDDPANVCGAGASVKVTNIRRASELLEPAGAPA
ncbi:MAG TPA: molybdopterin-dependent oxidoreductase [Candidatus Rubrimentiphilum sp.]|nr:molybdopterin-dependent oxidoreductase [Candidatus Rubrimentiphilum sp.]